MTTDKEHVKTEVKLGRDQEAVEDDEYKRSAHN